MTSTSGAGSGRCPPCAAFARRHQEIDARLVALLTPPSLTSDFRLEVWRQIRRDVGHEWHDWLPDVLHLLACGVAVTLYVMRAPVDAHVAIARGVTGALLPYAAMTIAMMWLEDSST